MTELKILYCLLFLSLDAKEIKKVMSIPSKYYTYDFSKIMQKLRIRHMSGLSFDSYKPEDNESKIFEQTLQTVAFRERLDEYLNDIKMEYINSLLIKAANEQNIIVKKELLSEIQSELRGNITNITTVSMAQLPIKVVNNLENGIEKTIKTGWAKFDNRVIPEPKNLVIICARPGMAKTAFALNYFINMIKRGASGIFISLEMSERAIANRIMARESAIRLKNLKNKAGFEKLPDEKLALFNVAAGNLSKLGDRGHVLTGSMSIEQIEEYVRMYKETYDIDFFMVDYVQLIKHNEKDRTKAVSDISIRLTALCNELDITGFGLCQLSREVDKRADKRPVLSDLRDSGQLEQDAAIVLSLYRENYYYPTNENINNLEVGIIKNRDNETGIIDFNFYGSIMEVDEVVGVGVKS